MLQKHSEDDDADREEYAEDNAVRPLFLCVIVVPLPKVDVEEERTDKVGDGHHDEDGPSKLEDGRLDELDFRESCKRRQNAMTKDFSKTMQKFRQVHMLW